ncbi:Remorin, C-terminal region [Musa troglodytarum]|uniref:Remorin, C-terminal region n=1 Tax=Musa troglodytarum TaxID=320322 RepID=A0A9E7FYC5_9LILI|nr:Remorin, C-terminal region [Musa troglodytarum]
MEYERIRKVQIGLLSPTKLRMKLLGPRNSARKGGSNSAKTSPSKNEDMKFARNSLLAGDIDKEESSKDSKVALRPENIANSDASAAELHDKESSSFDSVNRSLSNEKINTGCIKQDYRRSAPSPHQAYSNSNPSIIHPVRTLDEGGGNCHHGGNDTASSFEFHRVERIIQQPSLGLFSRHVPSKWNDAEKWIINRQIASPSVKKKTPAQNQGSHQTSSLRRVETDSTIAEHKASVVRALDSMRNEFNQTAPQDVVEKFSFVPHASNNKAVESVDSSPYSGTSGSCSRSGEEVDHQEFPIMKRLASEPTVVPPMQSVSMRDIGTEMTPVPTPLGSITPTRSSISSLPSTPRQGVASPLPTEAMKNAEQDSETKGGKDKLTEREMRLKIRREIAALGMQLGKMNIASWASKEEVEQCSPSPKALDAGPTEKEYEACAAAWEEAENTKHMARPKQNELELAPSRRWQKS